jgi:large subunit ribosomal protein L22
LRYSYNLDKKGIILASAHDLNASFKDLCAVCDAVRYMPVQSAIEALDGVINNHRPIEYRRHNKYMGSRHELQGKKGRYPKKCAGIVRKVVVNAMANATNKGENPDYMYIVHASANKTTIMSRAPPKGIRSHHSGGYGYGSARRSNLEFAKVEIGIAEKDASNLGSRMKRAIAAMGKKEEIKQKTKKQEKQQPAKKAAKAVSKPLAAPQPQQVPAKQTTGNGKKVGEQKAEKTEKV